MRIKHLHVTRYGPMIPFEHDNFGAFTLVHGPNEQGKTLLIDALVRMLFKRDLKKTYRRQFGNMDRVPENPEGFVVVESRGTEHKLEAKESLTTVFPITVTPEDFRNVFMVRDSDLSLNSEHGYYTRVTEKLTGLRSSEIERVLKAVQKRGRLRSISPDSDLSNNVEQGKVAERVAAASALVEEIRSLKESLQADGYDRLETELVEAREKLGRREEEVEVYRETEKTKRHKKALRTLGDLKRMLKTLEFLESLDDRELKKWQELDLKRSRSEADLSADKKELERVQEEIKAARDQIAAIEGNARKVQERLRRIDAEFKPRIDQYQFERAEYRRAEPQGGLYKRGLTIVGAVFVLLVAAYLIRPSSLLVGLAGAAVVAAAALAFMLRNLRKAQGVVAALIDGLYNESKRYGLVVQSVDDLMSAIGDVEEEARSFDQELLVEKANVDNLEKEKLRIENRLRTHADRLHEIDAEIVSLQARTRMETAKEYQTALDRRTKTEAAAAARREVLSELLPTDAEGDAALDEWKERIDAHLLAVRESPEIEHDAKTVSALKIEITDLKTKAREIEAALKDGSRRLHGVEVKAKELGVLEESPPCRTTQELDHISALIKDYVKRIGRDQRTAQEAIRIFGRIDAEEKTRVSDLFGPRSDVSFHIRSITGGRYTEAHYDLNKNAIYLVDAGNERIPAWSLSGGAYDQLYLSIRLSIAQRLLSEEKGFLLLDDPFVKADRERLRKMLDILKRLAGLGWQILYFSAKEEVAAALQDDVASGKVDLLRLDAPDPDVGAAARHPGAANRDVGAAGQGPGMLFD